MKEINNPVIVFVLKGDKEISKELASFPPHIRESREVIIPKIEKGISEKMIDKEIKYLILGE